MMPHHKTVKWCSRRQTDRMMQDNTNDSTSQFRGLLLYNLRLPLTLTTPTALLNWPRRDNISHIPLQEAGWCYCVFQKASCYYCYMFSEMIFPCISGSGTRILNDVKWHLQEQCIQCNYPSFIWKFIKVIRNKEYSWKIMHTGMMDRSSTK